MAHFAQIDENNIVTQVLVIDQETINTGHFGDPSTFIQTSYNTRGGVHYGSDGQPDNGVALRKNYAGIGYIYDSQRDAFYAPQPYNSWTLNEETCYWEAPTPMPTDGKLYTWDEDTLSWVEVQLGV
jgi:hypothetical protein